MNLAKNLDNRLNPLLLRELRQLVRNRFIIVLINLFIAVLVVVCIFTVLLSDHRYDQAVGGGLFAGLTGIMGFACFLAVVVYTAISTASERINSDLMFASALKPSQIVFGKFFSGALLTFLLMSITFPFVTLAYLLRGLDFQMVMISFVTTFLSIQVMNAMAIFVFSSVKSYVQMFVGIIGAGFLCMMGIQAVGAMFFAVSYSGHLGTTTVWGPFVSMVLVQSSLLAILLAAAIASITPPTANRLLPVRIVVTVVFLLSLAYCTFVFGAIPEIFQGWVVSWSWALIPLLVLVVCERETWTYRIKKTIPGNFLLRLLVFPFYTGSPCGLVWLFLLAATVALVCLGGGILLVPRATDYWMIPFALLFAFNYCITALLVRSFLFPKVSSDKTWAIVLFLLLLLTTGSILLFYLFVGDMSFDTGERYSDHFFSAFNPFLLSDYYDQGFRLLAAAGWAILLVLPFVFWFALRVLKFSPTPPSDMMTLEDAIAAVKYADENPMR